ncbi:MAG: hypothetical protein KatS3mg015_0362 [Fimbriimonadales bacterium]|nr:MAG: hypothetical protein KatS3mg015_0362 [Fimbriimonadales bacterium]
MKVTLAKFCDYACTVDGGKNALIGLFDTIGGEQYPLTHPTLFICVEFEFDMFEANQPAEIKLVLIDEDGKELVGVQGNFEVPPPQDGRPATMFHAFRFDGLQFPKPGSYRLDILHNGEPVGEARLYLVQGPPPRHYPPPMPPPG